MIYLDNSATTKIHSSTLDVISKFYMDEFYNPASSYPPAVSLDKEIDSVRALFDKYGFKQEEVVFTSGGTESNNIAILGSVNKYRKPRTIITSISEHPSVYNVFQYLKETTQNTIEFIGLNQDGTVNLEQLKSVLTEETGLVSVMQVNNETGAVNDLGSIRQMIDSINPMIRFHSDGVQAFCKIESGKSTLPCDLYSISGHKIHGPKGIGCLLAKKDISFEGVQLGGGQEFGKRSGTLNVPGIMGLGNAIKEYQENRCSWIETMRNCKIRLYENLSSIQDSIVNGPDPVNDSISAPHILNMSFMGVRGEVLLNALAGKGVFVSNGSACSSRKINKNRILNAMGIKGERQTSAIRFSLSPDNTIDEMDLVSEILFEQVLFLRKYTRR